MAGPTSPLVIKPDMAKSSLRTASVFCLAIWAAVWILFLLIRLSTFDIRVIPGIGPVMLGALAVAVLAPIVAATLTGIALVRQPRMPLNWLTLGCAIAALVGQEFLFLITKWL
jgi:hypothetical protein